MRYELSVCLRYLRPRRSRAYISANTVVSVVGIGVGVMTLIVVIAVMSGFASNLRERSIGLSSHLEIFGDGVLVSDWQDVEEKIRSVGHVVAVSPFVWGDLALRIDNLSYTIFFRGVDPEKVQEATKLREYLVYFTCQKCGETYSREEYSRCVRKGMFRCRNPECDFVGEDVHLLKSDLSMKEEEITLGEEEKVAVWPLVLGRAFCERFGLKLGDTIRIASAGIGAFGRRPRTFYGRLVGVFRSGLAEEDMKLGFTSLKAGQALQQMSERDEVHGFSVKLDDIEQCDEVKGALEKKLGSGYGVKTWRELRETLFRAIQQERVIMFIIVALITGVAALNIISSLTMTVMHKRREIAILRSMGARRRSITSIFALSGIIIGATGIMAGVVGGLLLSHNIDPVAEWVSRITGTTKLFSGEIFYLDRIPVDLSWKDVWIICGVAIVLSALASMYPAWKAATLDPAEVLRYE